MRSARRRSIAIAIAIAFWAVVAVAVTAVGIARAGADASVRPRPACAADEFALWTQKQLRGANVFLGRNPGGSRSGFGDGDLAQADFDALAAAGANYVQLSHAGLFAERPPYAPDPAAQASLDRAVAMAGRAGLYAGIAFRSGPGRNEADVSNRDGEVYEDLWSSRSAQDAWVAMVAHAAERYRDDPTVVAISPIVEPNAYARRGYPEPTEFAARFAGTLDDVTGLLARATAAVRRVDASTPILLEPDGFAGVPWLSRLAPTGDRRTVYTVHDYTPFDYTHQEPWGARYPGVSRESGRDEFVDRDVLARRLAPVGEFAERHAVPVAVTEFGVRRTAPNAAGYLADRISVQRGLGAWAVWVWQPAGFDDPFSVSDPGPVLDVLRAAWAGACARP
jgi:hypothetical protein